jgi:hypothetical protein
VFNSLTPLTSLLFPHHHDGNEAKGAAQEQRYTERETERKQAEMKCLSLFAKI